MRHLNLRVGRLYVKVDYFWLARHWGTIAKGAHLILEYPASKPISKLFILRSREVLTRDRSPKWRDYGFAGVANRACFCFICCLSC